MIGLPFYSWQAHNNFYINSYFTNSNFHNYHNHNNNDYQIENDEAPKFDTTNTRIKTFNTNKYIKNYYNNNQNNRRRNIRYAFNNANSYRQKENFELKGNLYNYNYRRYKNWEGVYNKHNNYNNSYRLETADVQDNNQCNYSHNIESIFYNNSFLNNHAITVLSTPINLNIMDMILIQLDDCIQIHYQH